MDKIVLKMLFVTLWKTSIYQIQVYIIGNLIFLRMNKMPLKTSEMTEVLTLKRQIKEGE